jgi:Chaperonin 10 Kd subunit.
MMLDDVRTTVKTFNGNDLRAIKNTVIVRDMEFGLQTTASGIILPSDDGIDRGIHPRWCQVYRVGKDIDFVKQGDWILVDHGRWSRGLNVDIANEKFMMRTVDPKDILGISDTPPSATYQPSSA